MATAAHQVEPVPQHPTAMTPSAVPSSQAIAALERCPADGDGRDGITFEAEACGSDARNSFAPSSTSRPNPPSAAGPIA